VFIFRSKAFRTLLAVAFVAACTLNSASQGVKRIVIVKIDGLPGYYVDRFVKQRDPETGKSDMKKYANQALEATKHCVDDLWKYATVAEANMYLGNLDIAKEFYIKASKDIPIREKLSMYTNAYAGYVALTKKENDEFTQFLKAQLLS